MTRLRNRTMNVGVSWSRYSESMNFIVYWKVGIDYLDTLGWIIWVLTSLNIIHRLMK